MVRGITVWPKVPIKKSAVWPNELQCWTCLQQSSVNWKQYIRDWTWKCKLVTWSTGPTSHCFYSFYTAFCPQHASVASWKVLLDQFTEEEKSRAWLNADCSGSTGTTWKRTVAARHPHSRTSLQHDADEKSSKWEKVQAVLVVYLSWKEKMVRWASICCQLLAPAEKDFNNEGNKTRNSPKSSRMAG